MAKIIKPCTIYLVRHGETDNNKQGIIQGSTVDAPLNQTGIKQAKEAAIRLKVIPFAAAFSSQAVRANQTAKIIGLQHQLAVTAHHILRSGVSASWKANRKLFTTPSLNSCWPITRNYPPKKNLSFSFLTGLKIWAPPSPG